ncbi:MAG TPA: hypothetical protein VHC43_05685 [Mycobacteriales bacterium]|nr:hypothetical protein [Mycobacteriales bacterium]
MSARRHRYRVPRHRRWAVLTATALMVGAPGVAFWAAPATGASGGSPGSDLAGINTEATSAAARVVTFTPGIAPLGNAVAGTIVEASLPYADSQAGTGPTTGGTAAPVWPGSVVANLGNAAATFSPSTPQALINLLNDPVAAHSAYPGQLHTHETDTFNPGGIGTATTTSHADGGTAHAVLTDLSLLGNKKASLVDVASTTADTAVTVNASSVSTEAHTHVGHITIAGVVDIAGIDSDAIASSDGVKGHHSAELHVGAVTVAGLSASIGPDGLELNKQPQKTPIDLLNVANTALTALQQAGITLKLLPAEGVDTGNKATSTSGAVQLLFNDPNIPNLGALLPQVPLPLPNSLGLEVDLGGSQASAAATQLPSEATGPTTTPASSGPTTTGGGTTSACCGSPSTLPTGPGVTSTTPGAASPEFPPAAAVSAFGKPLQKSWVIWAFLLSLLAAGPLLAYANWQLLRGRTS